jgi:hypothetical protein
MCYFINTTAQDVPNTVDDLIESGFQFVLDGLQVFFNDDVTEEDLEPFNIICVQD